MAFEFSSMTYFVSLFALMGVSLALTLLCSGGGKSDDPSPTHPTGQRTHSAR